jgi:hypothetical protein
VPGAPDGSELIARIIAEDAGERMPPPRYPKTLTDVEKELLARWIRQGAEFEDHWAYARPVRPHLPEVRDGSWPHNPIDRFILDTLERERLAPSPEADRATLLRRLSLDLIGLPPAPDEVDAFLADRGPSAYETVVDRLLASPEFGARWARPWLDAARYADSHGFQRDDLRSLWPYRDWVIGALNADMPFDQFTIEQLAGDLLPGATKAQKVATGLHRCAPINVEAGADLEETRINQVIDRVNTTAAVWLGTTLECAQCHDHKYDAFMQRDYYGLLAFFNNTAPEAEYADPKVPGSIRFSGPAMALADPQHDAQRESLATELAQLDHCLAEEPSVRAYMDRRADVARRLQGLAPATTLVMRELPRPRTTNVFVRGDFRAPGAEVVAATPAVLPAMNSTDNRDRLALARWLVDRNNPLTARVTVNRWWAELFGQGIVGTVEDFGIKGELPTHPELLDWLAVEFMDHGWSMKHILKTIVLSATYRQSSRLTPELLARDDRNRLLARGPRFRMDAEMIRDNALAIAGLLSQARGGPPIRPHQPDGLWVKIGGVKVDYVVSAGEARYRRGVYVVWKRGAPYPSFVNFDATARLACRLKRSRSNTPLQALTLLNDPVYVDAARTLARRIIMEHAEASDDGRLESAFRLCVARTPRPAELTRLRQLLTAERAAGKQDSQYARQLAAGFELPEGTAVAEFAAWFAVAQALLNLDETITKG